MSKKRRRQGVSDDQLKQMLRYCPDSGKLFYRVKRARKNIGMEAGSIDKTNGYVRVSLGGKNYFGHRLAVLLMTGEWPRGVVDHIDLNPTNNQWHNLRQCTHEQNLLNAMSQRKSASGVKGVYRTREGKWKAAITYRRTQIHVGRFDTVEAAKKARDEVGRKLHGAFYRP